MRHPPVLAPVLRSKAEYGRGQTGFGAFADRVETGDERLRRNGVTDGKCRARLRDMKPVQEMDAVDDQQRIHRVPCVFAGPA